MKKLILSVFCLMSTQGVWAAEKVTREVASVRNKEKAFLEVLTAVTQCPETLEEFKAVDTFVTDFEVSNIKYDDGKTVGTSYDIKYAKGGAGMGRPIEQLGSAVIIRTVTSPPRERAGAVPTKRWDCTYTTHKDE